MRHFPRSKLARDTADAMQGKSLFGDAPNGLFLAAPRRTGKSTFLHGLQVLLGPRCGELNLPYLLAGRFSADHLAGKTLMVCSEPLDARLANPARFNAFVSGERLTIEPKYRPAETLQPCAKLAWAFGVRPHE